MFISYARADGTPIAEELYALLGAQGLNPWLDTRDIPAGADRFDTRIDEGLAASVACVVVLTRAASASLEVESEWRSALGRNLTVIPVLCCDEPLPRRLGVMNGVDARRGLAGGPLTQLLQILRPASESERWFVRGRDADLHLRMTAYGRQSVQQQGDLFQGRESALAAGRSWLGSPRSMGLPLVVTGSPGAGKSAVLGRLAEELRTAHPGCYVQASGARSHDLHGAIAESAHLPGPVSRPRLAEHLQGWREEPLLLLVDSLDEMETADHIRDACRTLRDLAMLPTVRIGVATRPLSAGDPFATRGHLHSLGVSGRGKSQNLIDLDDPRYVSRASVEAYVAALLTRSGFPELGGNLAFHAYRSDAALTRRLSREIARRTGYSFLVAGMVASALATEEIPVDPDAPGFDPYALPSGAVEAVDRTLQRLPERERERSKHLLLALSYGRGEGLEDDMWLDFASALGFHDLTPGDITALLDGPASDFVFSSADDLSPRSRISHQALADDLRAGRRRRRDEREIVTLLRGTNWLDCGPYGRQHAPAHATAAGVLGGMVEDPAFLVSMAPGALRTELRRTEGSNPDDPAVVYDLSQGMLSDEPASNAAVLGLVAAIHGNEGLSRRMHELPVGRAVTLNGWLRPCLRPRLWLEGHAGPTLSVCQIDLDSRRHLVTAGADNTVRVWDIRHPDNELLRFEGHGGPVTDVLVVADESGTDRILSTSLDGTIRLWNPNRPEAAPAVQEPGQGPLLHSCVLSEPAGAVAIGLEDGGVLIWDPRRGILAADLRGDPSSVVDLVPMGGVGGTCELLAVLHENGSVEVWHVGTRRCRYRLPGAVMTGRSPGQARGGIGAVSGAGNRQPVLAFAISDREAAVWDPHADRRLESFFGHASGVSDVDICAWPGSAYPLVLSTAADGTKVWDPYAPGRWLCAIDAGEIVLGRSMDMPELAAPSVLTGTREGQLQVWDAEQLLGQQAAGSGPDWLWESVALPNAPRPTVVASCKDRTVIILEVGGPVREVARLHGHTDTVVGVTTIPWQGGTAIVSSSDDGTIRLWDAAPPYGLLGVRELHAEAVWGVSSVEVPGVGRCVASTSLDRTCRLWLPETGREIAVLRGHGAGVWRVRTGPWPGLNHDVVVTTSADETARVWDPLAPQAPVAVLRGHDHVVVDAAPVPGTGEWLTSSDDGTVLVWDPRDLARPRVFQGHTRGVEGLACVDWPGWGVVALSVSGDARLRVWSPTRPDRQLACIPLYAPGHGITALGPGFVAVATSRGLQLVRFHDVRGTP